MGIKAAGFLFVKFGAYGGLLFGHYLSIWVSNFVGCATVIYFGFFEDVGNIWNWYMRWLKMILYSLWRWKLCWLKNLKDKEALLANMCDEDKDDIFDKAWSTILLLLSYEVFREVAGAALAVFVYDQSPH